MPSTQFLLERNQKLEAKVRELEATVQERNGQIRERDERLFQQSVDLAILAPSHSLTEAMYAFVKKIAASQSKFAKEARDLL